MGEAWERVLIFCCWVFLLFFLRRYKCMHALNNVCCMKPYQIKGSECQYMIILHCQFIVMQQITYYIAPRVHMSNTGTVVT